VIVRSYVWVDEIFFKKLFSTLIKLMAGELIQSMGDIRPHGHLKLGRFTQHFVDVLDLEKTPLEFFEQKYPEDAHEEQRKYLGRFGVSGKMQIQKMAELSDGQKSRVVFAHLGRLRYVTSDGVIFQIFQISKCFRPMIISNADSFISFLHHEQSSYLIVGRTDKFIRSRKY
jgi:hypothetical protein